ncbi:helix-turn-helix domain-containing protein [Dellaglioa sp. BT-FLS60]
MFFTFNLKNPLILNKIEIYTSSNSLNLPNKMSGKFALIIIENGDVLVSLNSTKQLLTKQNWIIFQDKCNSLKLSRPSSDLVFTTIHFNTNNLVSFSYSPATSTQNSYNLIIPQFGKFKKEEKIHLLIKEIINAYSSNLQFNLNLNYLTSSLLINLHNQYIEMLSDSTYSVTPAKFDWIINWVTTNIEKPMTINEIADKFEMTPSYLTFLFNKYQGISTIKFIHALKLSKSKDLLLSTNLTISEISFYLSFNSSKYFMRLFKQENGITPTQFRNMYANSFIN